MLTRFALEQDIARRIRRAQDLMRERDLGALLIPAVGGPGMWGVAKYFTNLNLWAGRAYVVVGAEHPNPVIVMGSPYGAEWNKQDATTPWVEYSMTDAFGRALEVTQELAGASRRVGVEHIQTNWSAGEWERARQLDGYEWVDVTRAIDDQRVIKSAFEIEAMYDTGRILTAALERFAEVARPGARAWAAAAEAEAVCKAEGCYWGRQKYSVDLRPFTIPTPLDRRFTEDDIILFELVYCGPLGYWLEMTGLFSFKPLPPAIQAQVDAQTRVIQAAADATRPGVPIGRIAELTNQTWSELGYTVIGKHTPDCHSIGLDEMDGPNSWYTPEWPLEANMALSFHPSTLLEGTKAFLVSDNYLVTPAGGVRLSPKTWTYRQIDL